MSDSQMLHVAVEGFECDVDMARMKSWKATKMLAKTAAAQTDEAKAAAFIAYLDFVFGDELMARIEQAAGGDLASTEAVLGLAAQVLGAASKNS
jgi:hypothetical protein